MVSRANHHHCCLFMLDTLHWWADLPRLRASSGPDLIGPQSLTPACVYAPLLVVFVGWRASQPIRPGRVNTPPEPGIKIMLLPGKEIGKLTQVMKNLLTATKKITIV